jgi:site-specific recombinase XerD
MDEPATTLALTPERNPDLARNPFHTYLTLFESDESRRTMLGCLTRIAALVYPDTPAHERAALVDLVPWHRIDRAASVALRSAITTEAKKRGWSLAHTNKHLAALRGILAQSWEIGHIDADTRDRARKVLKNIKGTRVPKGQHIKDADTVKLLKTTAEGDRPIDKRDAAIISAFHATGGRCAEVAGMRIEHYSRASHGTVFTGKGNKQREIYLHEDAARYMEEWLAVLGVGRGTVFRTIDQWDHIGERALTARSLGRIVDKRRIAAGMDKITTHDYRRTLVGDMLDRGTDLATVQITVGHASPVTTASYDRRDGRRVREAVNKRNLAIHDGGTEAPTTTAIIDAMYRKLPGLDGSMIGRVLEAAGTEFPRAFPSDHRSAWNELAAIGRQMISDQQTTKEIS